MGRGKPVAETIEALKRLRQSRIILLRIADGVYRLVRHGIRRVRKGSQYSHLETLPK